MIENCRKYAIKKGGICISTTYVNSHKIKLTWKCSNGHIWKAIWSKIIKGIWCPYCSKTAKKKIQTLQQYAKNKNGKLLNKNYYNSYTKLRWKCKENHIWNATWESVGKGRWCPYCSSLKNEKLSREIIENKLKIKLTKTRIIYDNNKWFEFDGYNEKFKIAFEYNGYQHYIYPNHYHKTKKDFFHALEIDKIKQEYCLNKNIILIIIPYTDNSDLEKNILLRLESISVK